MTVSKENKDNEKQLEPSTDTVDGEFTGDPVKERRRIMKNIILISVAFLMNFNAYQGLARLQSTLNLEDGIGKRKMKIVETQTKNNMLRLTSLICGFY